jgi:hypothetical protein
LFFKIKNFQSIEYKSLLINLDQLEVLAKMTNFGPLILFNF